VAAWRCVCPRCAGALRCVCGGVVAVRCATWVGGWVGGRIGVAGEDKLAMFRSQYALLAKKLLQMEEVVDKAKRENERLKREVQSKVGAGAANSVDGEQGGGCAAGCWRGFFARRVAPASS
jgi:hypothetical protein